MLHSSLLSISSTIFSYVSGLLVGILLLVYDLFILILDCSRPLKSICGDMAVVTGGAGGLGSAICLELAKQGCDIAVVDVNFLGAQAVADRLGRVYEDIKVRAYGVDITDHKAVMQLRIGMMRDFNKEPTILINNAAIIMFRNILMPKPDEVTLMINVNLTAHLWMIDAFLPGMRAQKRGHIVAISSVAGQYPFPYFPVYASTKSGIVGLMRSLRLNLKIDGLYNQIRTTIVFPFAMDTNKQVFNMFELSSVSKTLPAIKAESAGRQVVQAMRRNKNEVTLPRFLEIFYRIANVAPSSIVDWILITFCRADLMMMKELVFRNIFVQKWRTKTS